MDFILGLIECLADPTRWIAPILIAVVFRKEVPIIIALFVVMQILGEIILWISQADIVFASGSLSDIRIDNLGILIQVSLSYYIIKKVRGYKAKKVNETIIPDEVVIQRYGKVLEEKSAGVIFKCKSSLPFTEERIKVALINGARSIVSDKTKNDLLEHLKVGYMSLADFLPKKKYEVILWKHNVLKQDPNSITPQSILESFQPARAIEKDSFEESARLKEEFHQKVYGRK